ncbi:hypothetical protein EX30DRAFT_11832 [Ascodesmis nigricans]|uniref:Uncharacterized protein n=1 Tax=Ascodesmis nigricans TaxID=341454 RepID=A0A4S2N6U0_9PEZI|nr:hypothetical protein EX30DRAFT_11832 [Ascodesmis nigricans]
MNWLRSCGVGVCVRSVCPTCNLNYSWRPESLSSPPPKLLSSIVRTVRDLARTVFPPGSASTRPETSISTYPAHSSTHSQHLSSTTTPTAPQARALIRSTIIFFPPSKRNRARNHPVISLTCVRLFEAFDRCHTKTAWPWSQL